MKELSFSIVSHEGIYTFTHTLLGFMEPHDLTTFGLVPFKTKVEAAFAEFDKSLKRDMKDSFTDDLEAADAARDDRHIGFRMYVEAAGYRASADWQAASERIMEVIRRYGTDAWRKGYATESAAINNLLGDLAEEPLATDVATIEANSWKGELEQAQQAFEAIYEERLKQEKEDIMPIRSSRKALVEALRNLLSMMELQQQVNNNEPLTSIISSTDELIGTTMTTARAEQTRKAN